MPLPYCAYLRDPPRPRLHDILGTARTTDNHAREDAQQNFGHDGTHPVADAEASLISKDDSIYRVANNACEEHHKGINDALYQRQSDHIAVGYVPNFVCHDRSDFFGLEPLQHPGADGNECIVTVPAGSEGIRCVGGKMPTSGMPMPA